MHISDLGQHKLKYTSKVLKATHLPQAPMKPVPRPGIHAYVTLNKPFPALRTVPSTLFSFCRWSTSICSWSHHSVWEKCLLIPAFTLTAHFHLSLLYSQAQFLANNKNPRYVLSANKPVGSKKMEMANESYCFLNFYFLTKRHVGSQLPAEGSNLCPLRWKHSLNHWTAKEVPKATYFKRVKGNGKLEKLTKWK